MNAHTDKMGASQGLLSPVSQVTRGAIHLMARCTLHFDSISTEQLRAAIVSLHHEEVFNQPANGCDQKQGTVGLNGPDHWTFTTPPLMPASAMIVCGAVHDASVKPSTVIEQILRDQ